MRSIRRVRTIRGNTVCIVMITAVYAHEKIGNLPLGLCYYANGIYMVEKNQCVWPVCVVTECGQLVDLLDYLSLVCAYCLVCVCTFSASSLLSAHVFLNIIFIYERLM